jgi:hypothetical protein
MVAEQFRNRDLSGSRFEQVDLSGVHIHNPLMTGVRITGAWLEDVVLDGAVEGSLTVNGVDVVPYVEAELNRRFPGREQIYAVTTGGADSFREAYRVLEGAWRSTYDRLRALPPERLHERVDEQWSPIENLCHLVFAIDAWAKRTLLGDPDPYSPLDVPHTEMGEVEGVPSGPATRPSLDEVLALHDDRMAVLGSIIDALTDEGLEGTTTPNTAPGYPEAGSYAVRRCLRACVIEEWEHRGFIERDLEVLEAG